MSINAIKARLARVAGKWPTKGDLAPGADDLGPKTWAAHGPLRCHATEKGRARQWTQACADAEFVAHAPADITALLAEVERLRSINDDYLLEMGRQHALLRDQAREAQAERAAVVAWLRAEAEAAAQTYTVQAGEWANRIDALADLIERGEHRRGESE